MTTYTIYSGTSDGYVSTSASTYAGANSGTGAVADSNSSTILLIGQSVSIAPNYSCYQSFLEFDTSTVVGGVKTATLTMTPIDVSGNVTFFQINVSDYDWGGTVDTGDFRSPAQLSAFTLRATLDTTSASVDTAIDFLSQGSFGSIINTSGFTRLIAYSSNNSTATTPGSNEYVQFYPADQTGTTKDPKLVVSTPTANDWYFVGISNLVAVASGNLALVETGISGLQSGDLMVACIGMRSTTVFTPPASWNTVGTPQVSGNTTVNTTSSIASGRMDWIIRGGSAPALTWNRTGGDLGLGRIVAYRNIGTITLDQHSEVTLGTANTAMANSGVTTSQAHELCIAMNVGARTATTWSAMDADTNPAGASGAIDTTTGYIDVNFGEDQWTERSDDASTSGADGSLEICDAVKSTAGATGTFRATASLSARNVQIVAIFKATSSVSNNKTLNVSMSRSISVLRAITKRNLVSVSSLVTVSRAIGHVINEQLASIATLYRSVAHTINIQQANVVSLAKVATKNALLRLRYYLFKPEFLHPTDLDSSMTISSDGLTVTNSGTVGLAVGQNQVRSTNGFKSGRKYLELTTLVRFSGTNDDDGWGLGNSSYIPVSSANWPGSSGGTSVGWYPRPTANGSNAYYYNNGATNQGYGYSTVAGETNAVAIDFDRGRIYFRHVTKETGWLNDATGLTHNPETGVGGLDFTAIQDGSLIYFIIDIERGGDSIVANFGTKPFVGTVPNGFDPWALTSVTESGTKINGPSNQVVSNVAIGSTTTLIRSVGHIASAQIGNIASLLRSVGKLTTVSQGSSVSLLRAMARTVNVQVSSTVSNIRSSGRAIAVQMASAVSVTKLQAAGKLLSATLANTVTLRRSVGKNHNVTLANTVTLRRSIGRIITEQTSLVVTLLKLAAKPITIQQANTTTLIRSAVKRVTITQASVTTLRRNMSRAINVSMANVVTLRRSIGRLISIAFSPSVALTAIGGKLKSISIQLGNAVTLSRSVVKRATMQVGSIVTMQRNLTKTISFGISHVINDIRSVSHAISVQLSHAVTLLAGANLPIQYFQTLNVQQGIAVSTTRLKIHFNQIINIFMGKSLIWNENDRSTADTTTISSDDLTYGPPFAGGAIRGNIGLKKKAYFEGIFYSVGSGQTDSQPALGVATSAKSADNLFAHFKPGNQIGENNVVSISVQVQTWFVNTNGSSTTVTIADLSGQTFGIALDYEAGEVRFVINGSWVGGGGSFGGATAFPIVTSGLDIYPFIGYYNDSPSYFTLTPKDGYLYMPSGYAPWQSAAMNVSVARQSAHVNIINVLQSISVVLRNSITKAVPVALSSLVQLAANPSRFKNILVQLGSAVTVIPQSARGKLISGIQVASTVRLNRSITKNLNVALSSSVRMFRSLGKFVNVQIASTVFAIKNFAHIVNVQLSNTVSLTPLRSYLRAINVQVSSSVRNVRSVARTINVQLSSSVRNLRSTAKRIVTTGIASSVSISSHMARYLVIRVTQAQNVSASAGLAKLVRAYVSNLVQLTRRHIRDSSGATEPAVVRSGNNVFLITVRGHDGASVQTLRFGSAGKLTLETDTPPNTYFDPRVKDPGNFERNLSVRGLQQGSVGEGNVLLTSSKPGWTGSTLDYLLDWAFEGYSITIQSLTSIRQAVSLAKTLFNGTIEQLLTDDAYSIIGFKIHDRLTDLDKPFLTETYAGTTIAGNDGTANGNVDMKGKRKQQLYGTVYGIEPQTSNAFDLVFDVSNGPLQSMTVYDGMVQQTLDTATGTGGDVANLAALLAWTPVAGKYITCLAEGKFRAGNIAGKGWTVNAVGDGDTAAEILLLMFEDFGIDYSQLLPASFTAMDAFNNSSCGILIKEDETFLSAARRLLVGPAGDVLPDRNGKFGLWYFDAPTLYPVVELEEDTIIGKSLQRTALGSTSRNLPVYRVTMKYRRFETPLNSSQFNGAATDADRAFAANEWRSVVAEDTSVLDRHPNAIEVEFETCFVNEADALAEAERHLALFSVRRDGYIVKAMLDYADDADLGSTIMLTVPRFGLDDGKNYLVIGRIDDFERKNVTLILWG